MYPDGDLLSVPLLPIPMGEQMQHGLRSPPGFVVIEVVLRKAAHVDDAELRVDGGPSVGCGLAAIIESSPREATGEPFARGVELPPFFCELRPCGVVEIVGADPVAQFVGLIDAASRDGAGRFRAN